jgi:hypothetical protein
MANEQNLTKSNQKLQKQHNLIGDWIKTKEQYNVVVSHVGSVQLKNASNKMMNELVTFLGLWKFSVGNNQETSAEEYRYLAMFIKDNFSEFTIEELKSAMTMSINGKFENKYFGSFSPIYVSAVLNMYREYRAGVMRKVEEDAEAHRRAEQKRLMATPEYRCDQMKSFINEQFETYQKEKEIFDPFNLIYNFLRKHNIMQVPKQIVDEAMEYGKRKALSEKNTKSDSLKSLIGNSGDTEEDTKKYARNFVIQKYFDSKPIKEILKLIKVEHFKETE